jgi:SAM-dependent methyltransferase
MRDFRRPLGRNVNGGCDRVVFLAIPPTRLQVSCPRARAACQRVARADVLEVSTTLSIPTFTPAQVRRYYDRNTSAFIRRGEGGGVGAIHRAVWGPGVTDRSSAFRYVENRITEWLQPICHVQDDVHVVDLGCGIGASLCYLAQQLPIRGTGITLSPVQAALGQQRIASLALSDRVRCLEGDYIALPPGLPQADLAYAIESFVHGPSPQRFFAEAARLIRPGGVLIVCDDVRRETRARMAARSIDRFVRGWHVNSLLTRDALIGVARSGGFAHESTTDLTSYLELGRPRDRAIAALVALVAWLPMSSTRLAPLIGGSALQTCLARGWLAYELTVFRRTIG